MSQAVRTTKKADDGSLTVSKQKQSSAELVTTELTEHKAPHSACKCLHCNATMPIGSAVVFENKTFCCHGCCAAYQWLSAEGLEHYYDLKNRFDATAGVSAANITVEEMADFDSAWYAKQYIRPAVGNSLSTRIYLEGIHCAACVWLLEKLPKLVAGVLSAQVSLARSTVDIVWDPAVVSLSLIAVEIRRLGYRPHPMRGEVKYEQRAKDLRKQLAQVGIAFACSGNSMLLAAALYLGEFYGMSAEHIQLLRGASTVVGLVALLGPGWTFFRGAISAIRTRTPHMDVPVATALAVGAISGVWNTLRGTGELYYDSLSMLVFLLLAGRYLQSRQQQSACDSLDILAQLTPRKARRIQSGKPEMVSSESLQIGDTLEVLEGEVLAADGIVIQGTTEIDQALLTGEALPVVVANGDQVFAGTVNRGSVVRVLVNSVGEESRVGKLAATIEKVAVQKTPLVQLADKLAGRFVILVLAVAVLTGAYCYFYLPEVAVDRVVSLLIVACPCALGLATPLAVSLALGEAAKRGILIRSGEALQRLANGGIILLDKTGTLTTGELEVREVRLPQEYWAAVVTLESKSSHPIAHALVARLSIPDSTIKDVDLRSPLDVCNVEYKPGGGIRGVVANQVWVIGHVNYLISCGVEVSDQWKAVVEEYTSKGLSPILVARDLEVVGSFGLADDVRPEANQAIADLKSDGWQVGILSGDNAQVVAMFGDRLGIEKDLVWGSKSPEEKLAIVHDLQQQAKSIVMVGDGVNDAAALAQADVGIAVKGGAEISLQAAAIYLKNSDLGALRDLSRAGRNTINAIQRNFIASISYNIFAVGLAVVGLIHPLIAAGLMPISSITVVGVTLATRIYPKAECRTSGSRREE